jgi:IS605 OrfB family transposase
VRYNIDTIVIGYNEGWKQECEIGKINNQNFQQIPFLKFVNQIKYKARKQGINVVTIDEAYTSGTSFLNTEPPIKDFYNKTRRIRRGLFRNTNNQTNKIQYINADVNAAYQILNKYLQTQNNCYVVEGLQDITKIRNVFNITNILPNFERISYALNPNKVTINGNIAIDKLY